MIALEELRQEKERRLELEERLKAEVGKPENVVEETVTLRQKQTQQVRRILNVPVLASNDQFFKY